MILAHYSLDRHAQQQVTDQHDGCADCWPDIAVAAVDAAGSLLISSGPLMRFGYTRVSTVAQTLHPQHDLKAAGASKVYSDNMSGARATTMVSGIRLCDAVHSGDRVMHGTVAHQRDDGAIQGGKLCAYGRR